MFLYKKLYLHLYIPHYESQYNLAPLPLQIHIKGFTINMSVKVCAALENDGFKTSQRPWFEFSQRSTMSFHSFPVSSLYYLIKTNIEIITNPDVTLQEAYREH